MTSPFLLVSTEVLCPSNWGVYIRTKGKHLMLWGPALCAASNFHSFDSFLSTFLGINILETKHTRQVPRCSNVSICLYPRLLSYVLIAHGHVPYMTISMPAIMYLELLCFFMPIYLPLMQMAVNIVNLCSYVVIGLL
jgi:hypothetical protein